MQNYSLHTIAQIDSGKSFREKPEGVPDGGCSLIQMKDVSLNGIGKNPITINLDEINPSQLLQDGDILFVAKGNNNYSATFRSSKPAVAVSFFFIIRPDISKVYPEYLTWYLNSSQAQSYFDQMRTGALIGNIRKETLETMMIPVPELEKQITIVSINQLWRDEKEYSMDLIFKKEIYYKNLLSQISASKIRSKRPDNMRLWYDLLTHSNYYPAHIYLKNPITIDGELTSELVCSLNDIKTDVEEFNLEDGGKYCTPQVSGWEYILLKDLNKWNDPEIPNEIKQKTILKHINQSQIKKIELKDRKTRTVVMEKENIN